VSRRPFTAVREAVLRARGLEGDARAAYLESLDPALRREVASLLEAESGAPPLLETGALARGLGAELAKAVAPVAAAGLPARIGPYRIVRRIGEGGMGEVFRAEQTDPVAREVALKVVRAGLDSERVLARFEAERRAIGMMSHPYIAQVLDAGTVAGNPYFAMELIAGDPITRYCDAGRLTTRHRVELFLKVCEGVQHAHRRGILHRDLKPSNILVVEQGGVASPRIIDFGIAKALQDRSEDEPLTREGHVVGTPEYMSPEQAGAIEAPVDERSDVYALGVLLHELLVGRRPNDFRRATPLEMVRILRDATPRRPSEGMRGTPSSADAGDAVERASAEEISTSRGCTPDMLERQLRGDLDAIVVGSLGARPSQRYESVAALMVDVGRYLRGESVRGVDTAVRGGPARDNLPRALTRWIGRSEEAEACGDLLADGRLVTLTGVGGAGKTRLAVHVARERLRHFPDGLWFADLTRARDGAGVERIVADAVGAVEEPGTSLHDVLLGGLAERRCLVVLDNCEHVLEAAATIASDLLRTAPGLAILATSREALGVEGERCYQVPALSLETSVELFIDRASLVESGFRAEGRDRDSVTAICRRLEGIPLAIELAASRVKHFGLEELLERLEDRLRILSSRQRGAPARHQTLRATIQWSYDLLDPADRALLRGLSVFAGGWTLEAAHAVVAPDVDELDAVERHGRLVDKSLVHLQRSDGGRSRFQMLDMLRAFAGEQLDASEEGAALRDRHLAWCMRIVGGARDSINRSPAAARRIDREHDNILAAFAWAKSAAPADALRIVAELGNYWWSRGHAAVGLLVAREALALPVAQDASPDRARALHALGALSFFTQDVPAARVALEKSLALWEELGDRESMGPVLSGLGAVHSAEGRPDLARARFMELLELGRDLGLDVPQGIASNNLALLDQMEGDPDAARERYDYAVRIWRRLGDRVQLALSLNALSGLHLDRGDPTAALPCVVDAIGASLEVGSRLTQADALDIAGVLFVEFGDVEHAATSFGAAAALRADGVPARDPRGEDRYGAYEQRVRSALGDSRFAALLGAAADPDRISREIVGRFRERMRP
jgi:predicted ATPase/serine/threonine protein kinase